MGKYFKQTREDYDERLKDIEQAFFTERCKIINRNKDDINALFKEQSELEIEKMSERASKEEEYTKDLDELRTLDANDQQQQKIKLEKEMQIL